VPPEEEKDDEVEQIFYQEQRFVEIQETSNAQCSLDIARRVHNKVYMSDYGYRYENQETLIHIIACVAEGKDTHDLS
jgi:hypothetical protein